MPPAPPVKVAFLGFSEFERHSLASCLRLAAQRAPRYAHTPILTEAELLVADADHAPSVQLVLATERQDHTVFVGARAPQGSRAWMQRPIDALQLMRHLDALGGGARAEAIPGVAVVELREDGAADDARPTAPPAAPADDAPRTIEVAMAARADAAADAAAVAPAPAGAPTQPARRPSAPAPRALLVDDSEVALRYLQQRLEPWGVRSDLAADSAAALALLAGHSYQLIFVDVELGEASELDGLALCRRIKQSEAAVEAAVVLVSAHHSELDRVRGALAGCDAYLGKPLDEAALRRLLLRQGCRAPAAALPG